MHINKKWDMYFKEQNCPCFITEIKTNVLCYCNEKFLTHFNIKHEINDIIGKKITDISDLKRMEFNLNPNEINSSEIFEYEVTDKLTSIVYEIKSLLSLDEKYIISKIILTDNLGDYKFEEAMYTCLDILQLPSDKVIPSLLKVIEKFYNANSAFVYQLDYHNKKIKCDYDLSTNPDFEKSIEDKVHEYSTTIFEWIDHRNDIGIIEANIEKTDDNPMSNIILELFTMKNVTLYVAEYDNIPFALIGLNERKEGYLDYRLLKSISTFIGQNLLSSNNIEKSISRLKNIDELTGFYNRINYSHKIDLINQSPPESIGVIFVNINGLRNINEKLGYVNGDKHIKLASDKLKYYFDYDFYRISGDEFVGIAENVDEIEFEDDIQHFMRKLKKNKDYNFAIGYSYSITPYSFSKVISEAEVLLYINKQEYYANNNRKFYDVKDSSLSNLLLNLENDEFLVYLQPQVDLIDGSLYGAEALIRRFDKNKKLLVFPDQFIPLYEQKSIIRHVDIFVIITVCQLLQQWDKESKTIPISVNLSRVTLMEFDIVNTIASICDKYNVPHHLLVIEITERVGLLDNDVATSIIDEFMEKGFKLSLDDFGCAYSNIVTLANISVDEVKIDKSLVDNIIDNKKNKIIVQSVIEMCDRIGNTHTLAEGIETEEQAKILCNLNCKYGQGYLYSKPITIEEFVEQYIN